MNLIEKHRRSQNGFGIAEVLVAMLLATIGFAALGTLSQAMTKSKQSTTQDMDFVILKSSLQNVLSSPNACVGAFKESDGVTSTEFDATQLPNDPIPVQKLKVGGSYLIDLANPKISGGANVSKFEFVSAVADGTETIGATNYNRYLANLYLEMTKAPNSFGGATRSNTFLVVILVDAATKRIDRCLPVVQNSNSVTNNVYFGSRTDTFDLPGSHTWTVPTGVKMVSVQIWGAGGGGGGASTSLGECEPRYTLPSTGCCGGGGGGGSGAFVRRVVEVVPETDIQITVGAGGAYSIANGTYGTPSSFGAIIAPGGNGGFKANATGCATTGYGGGGGLFDSSQIDSDQFKIQGSAGQPGSFVYTYPVGCVGGVGGSAPGGGGGPNTSPGGGGSGDTCYASGKHGGSPGGNGRVTIQY
jgi:hypothetical protein